MSRQDKIGAVALGLLLFAGLFYFIYTTMKSPLPADFGDEEVTGETFNADDEALLDQETADEGAPVVSTGTATAPAADAEAPVAPVQGKK